MPTDRDWATGYLEQGRADLKAASRLDGETSSTVAMLLQMVFEKLAKAAMLKMGTMSYQEVKRLHCVASRLIETLKLYPDRLEVLGDGNVNAWSDALPWVIELENAHPTPPRDAATGKPRPRSKGHPILEYPWEGATSGVRWPERDLPIAQSFADPRSVKLARLMKFAAALSKHHDRLFTQTGVDVRD